MTPRLTLLLLGAIAFGAGLVARWEIVVALGGIVLGAGVLFLLIGACIHNTWTPWREL